MGIPASQFLSEALMPTHGPPEGPTLPASHTSSICTLEETKIHNSCSQNEGT